MKSSTLVAISVAASILFLLLFTVFTKNGLIGKDETVQASWAQIETMLQRRADLIPNLVATVKGYAAHEKGVFEEVAQARGRLLSAQGATEKAAADSALSGALGRLLAIRESYPTLKADANFIRLQDELAGSENRITVARTRYNTAVRKYNAAIRKFPGNLFAGDMELERADHYNPPNIANIQTAPKVTF
jgi:LemA protein